MSPAYCQCQSLCWCQGASPPSYQPLAKVGAGNPLAQRLPQKSKGPAYCWSSQCHLGSRMSCGGHPSWVQPLPTPVKTIECANMLSVRGYCKPFTTDSHHLSSLSITMQPLGQSWADTDGNLPYLHVALQTHDPAAMND